MNIYQFLKYSTVLLFIALLINTKTAFIAQAEEGDGWQAEPIETTVNVYIKGSDPVSVTIMFTNTGTITWSETNEVALNYRYVVGDYIENTDGQSAFHCTDWVQTYRPTYVSNIAVPNQTGSFDFNFCNDEQLPIGIYQETYDIAHKGDWFYFDKPTVRVTVFIHVEFNPPDVKEIPQTEIEALVALYNNTNGSKWINQKDWLKTNNPCSWYGVTCADGHVITIRLENNLLTGDIPSEIDNLTQLKELHLGWNQLTTLPSEIGNLFNLTHLFLFGNKLTSIPPEIGKLTNLEFLVLNNNKITTLPPEIKQLVKLISLPLYNNRMTALPSEIGNLTNIEELDVRWNELTTLPQELLSLSKLTILKTDCNKLGRNNLTPEIIDLLDRLNSGWSECQNIPLTFKKTAPTTANFGDPFTYILTVQNNTNVVVTHLTITDSLPIGSHYVSGGTLVGNVVNWTIPALEATKSISVELIVTATRTVTNQDYQVSSAEGYTAVGTEKIVTVIIPPRPTITNSVQVLDEYNLPVANALIYRNGQPVIARTDRYGIITFTNLYTGESLAALQQVYEQPTNKESHNIDGTNNFAFRVYRTNMPITINTPITTSMPITREAKVEFYVVPGDNLTHTLTVQSNNTVVLFNIVVSVEWDASDEYIQQLISGLKEAANLLYDATNGQMYFGWVTIYDNKAHWSDADIQIYTHNHTVPYADIGGINTTGAGRLVYKGVDPEPGGMILGRYWDGNGASEGDWSKREGYTTITHEFGHYALFLFDEYFYYEDNDNENLRRDSRCSIDVNAPASLMYYQYTKSEFCSLPEHYPEHHGGPQTRQTQIYGSQETSWMTIQGVYSDLLQTYDPNSPSWAIVSPRNRGVEFLIGPAKPPLSWLKVNNQSTSSGTFEKKLTIQYEGKPIWGALVSLHKKNGEVIDQGLTDKSGNIGILGVSQGDTIFIRNKYNSLATSVTVKNSIDEIIELEQTIPNRATNALSVSNAPLVIIIPRQDGTTIDYFVEQTDQLSTTVSAYIHGEDSPPEAFKTMTYEDEMDRYLVAFTGFKKGNLDNLTFQMQTSARTGFMEVGIAHKRGWTGEDDNGLDLTSHDGNVVLHVPQNSFTNPTYIVLNPTNAVPGSPPTDKVYIGETYSIQPSGALTGSQKAMALTLNYQSTSLGKVDEATIKPYYWAYSPLTNTSGQWIPVLSYTLNLTTQQVSASIDLFGSYTLIGDAPKPFIDGIFPSSGNNMTATEIAILGRKFEKGAVIRLGNVLTITQIELIEGAIKLTIPAGLSPGVYDITVINPDNLTGRKVDGFTVTSLPPSISSIWPITITNQTTATLTLTGTRFVSPTMVRLGENINLTVISANSQTLQVVVPTGLVSDTYEVIVINPDGQQTTSSERISIITIDKTKRVYLPVLLK